MQESSVESTMSRRRQSERTLGLSARCADDHACVSEWLNTAATDLFGDFEMVYAPTQSMRKSHDKLLTDI